MRLCLAEYRLCRSNAEEPLYNFLAENQQSLLCLIPGTWTRLCFYTVVLFMNSSTRLSSLSEQTKSCSDARQQRCQRRWTETSFPKHFNLWQLNVGDCGPPGISNNAPLFYLHFFSCWCFLSFSSLSPSIHCPSNVSAEREAERLSCSQCDTSLLIMHQWHHYKSNHRVVINARLIKKTGWRSN